MKLICVGSDKGLKSDNKIKKNPIYGIIVYKIV